MLFPIEDRRYNERTPLVSIIIVGLNLVFFFGFFFRSDYKTVVFNAGIVPASFRASQLLTHMFLHGGPFHILFNMLFFWFFGKNLERKARIPLFLLIYFGSGIAGGLAHIGMTGMKEMPAIGASGAVYGILTAYLVVFFKHRIKCGYFTIITAGTTYIHSGLFIFFFFILMEIIFVIIPAGNVTQTAHWAHIGGAAFGAAVALVAFRLLEYEGAEEVKETSRPTRQQLLEQDKFRELDYIPIMNPNGTYRRRDKEIVELPYERRHRDGEPREQ